MISTVNHIPAGNYLQGYGNRHFVVADRFDDKGIPCGTFEILVSPGEEDFVVIENTAGTDSTAFQAGMAYAVRLKSQLQ